MDYTAPTSENELTFKSWLPRERFSFATLVLPFDGPTWTFLVLSSVSIGLSLTAMDNDKAGKYKSASQNVFIALATLIHVSLPNRWFAKARPSNAVVLLTWVMLSTLLGMAYESNLLSIMVVKR